MTSEFQNNQNFNQTSEAELPQSGVNASDRVKEYGKKSFAPFIDVLHKYQGEITPYFSALDKALQGAINALKNESGQGTEAEKMVSEWFSEASQWFNQAKSKFEATDSNALMNYLQEQGRNKPAVMFATSYVAGLFFGRLGRHVGSQLISKAAEDLGPEFSGFGNESRSPSNDPNIH